MGNPYFNHKKVSELNEENIEYSINSIINNFEENYSLSFNIIISQIVFLFYSLRKNNFQIYFEFLKKIETFEENNKSKSKIFDVFTRYLLKQRNEESKYLLEKMIKNNLLEPKIVQNEEYVYFIHYMPENEIDKLRLQISFAKNPYFIEDRVSPLGSEQLKRFFAHFEELSANDFELHKKLINEGVNPNEIARIIRNDDIEKLQEISSQENFDFKQCIKPSIYERYSFINQWNVSLTDYAAFFGSIKCFKYLFLNNAKMIFVRNAIAGGNEEIFHIYEQNHLSFKDAYETAIKYHRNDIFKYIYENKLEEVYNDDILRTYSLEELGKICILYHNYEIFSFLQEKGMKINNYIINESSRIGNLLLTKYFLKFYQIPNDILVFSAESGNIELVNYILQQKGININAKDIYLFYLIFVLIILYFKIIFGNYLNYLIQH